MYLGYHVAQWLTTQLPAAAAFGGAEGLADLLWRCAGARRAAVDANLARLLDASSGKRTQLGREVFRNFGRYLVEFFTIHRQPDPALEVAGYDHLAQARRGHRGAILLTAHLGNWEVGAILIHRMGGPVTAVALPHEDPRMDALFNRQRQRCGLDVIPLGKGGAARGLQRLHEGRLLGLLGDWDLTGGGLTMPVGNLALRLPRGPAVLSLRSQAPVVPVFLIRESRWRFRLCVEPPIWPESRSETEDAVRTLTRHYAAVFERYLTRFPEQWMMFQSMNAT